MFNIDINVFVFVLLFIVGAFLNEKLSSFFETA